VTLRDRALLWPLGFLYGALGALRVSLYRRGLLPSTRLDGPVLSVGNLSVGGTGKTPVVGFLAALLRDAGLPVAILSRGYGGARREPALVVSDGERVLAGASQAGDEPVMLARALPGVVVAVGPRRDVVGRAVEARFGRRVHLLDDGFQHLRLRRDLDLLCLDASDDSRWPLPAGRLREFPGAARRADLVLLTRAESAREERLAQLERRLGRERAVRVALRPDGFAAVADGSAQPAPRRPFVVAGVARPERLLEDVRRSAGELAGQALFRDHHPFTTEDCRLVGQRARAAGADALVTTAKDAARWPAVDLLLPLLVLRQKVEPADEARLRERVLAAARRVA